MNKSTEIIITAGPRDTDQPKTIPRSPQMKTFFLALKVSSFSIVEVTTYLPGLVQLTLKEEKGANSGKMRSVQVHMIVDDYIAKS